MSGESAWEKVIEGGAQQRIGVAPPPSQSDPPVVNETQPWSTTLPITTSWYLYYV
ncbi:hypothetical protein Scep_020775 [Stephania cephalantha]|uniref:Uncharacterized protein n=1 Tax=Stephania cephalantha TaxID=152367 RepID=A0AAP0ID84_9MAGN